MTILNFARDALRICATAAVLAGCSASPSPIGIPVAPSAPAATAARPDSKLSGEALSSSKAKSTCYGKGYSLSGTFVASGKATGPFPGTFTARGKVDANIKTLRFHEHFVIRSGSHTIVGTAKIPISGSPTFACSKSGALNFDLIILNYRAKHPRAQGDASAELSGVSFSETFN